MVYWLSKLWDVKVTPIEQENHLSNEENLGLFRVYYEWDDILPGCCGDIHIRIPMNHLVFHGK